VTWQKLTLAVIMIIAIPALCFHVILHVMMMLERWRK